MLARFTKLLDRPREALTLRNAAIRTFREPADIPAWLTLRAAAFGELAADGRAWTPDDFRREFTAKPWWSPERMWLATIEDAVVGAVTLGRSGRPPNDLPSAMWLMVDRPHRRAGLGRALLTTLEHVVWEAGERRVTLETHSKWTDAVQLYTRCGYERVP